MTNQHRATPDDWAQQEDWANRSVFSGSSCIIELRDRIEALEVGQQPLVNYAPVKPEYRDKLDRLIEQDRSNPHQPEPEGVIDDELLRTYGIAKRDYCYEGPSDDWPKRAERAATIHGLRAVLARYGTPTTQPVPVSERLPGAEDCDAEGRCWWWHPAHIEDDFDNDWVLLNPEWAGGRRDSDDSLIYTHWLSANALPTIEAPND
jgi:hypothetical protein